MTQPMPALIGHRGLPTKAPENTRASILAAKEQGIAWIEIDVTMAGDGSLVIMHDPDLRLFGQPKTRLINIGVAELQKVDAGGWFSKAFLGEPLLFLDDLLILVKELKLGLNLEIKINDEIDVNKQVNAIQKTIAQYQLPHPAILISSFNHLALQHFRQINDAIQIGALFKSLPEHIPESLNQIQPISVHCEQSMITKEQLKQYCHLYPVYCYTVNSAQRFSELLDWGVSGVFCDHANQKEMLQVLAQHNK
jgi:glycerophosphoryl diester phosphodiesterase